jgi:hypothetical protein
MMIRPSGGDEVVDGADGILRGKMRAFHDKFAL